jgi:hypothetical protein
MKFFSRHRRNRPAKKSRTVLGSPEVLESRIALAISPYETYALLLINRMRADPAKFGTELRNLHNNRSFVSTHGMRGDDPIWTDLRADIKEAEGRTTAAGIKWYSGFDGRGGQTFLSVMSSLPRTGPLVDYYEFNEAAESHSRWMIANGYAHTGQRANSPVAGLGYNPSATPDVYQRPGDPDFFRYQGENISYGFLEAGSFPATYQAWRQGKLTWEAYVQRAVYADTLGFMLEMYNGSTTSPWGHLLNLASYSPDHPNAPTNAPIGNKQLYTINAIGLSSMNKGAGEIGANSNIFVTTHRIHYHADRSYVGVVTYRDLNNNKFYDVGEGMNVNMSTYVSSPWSDSGLITDEGGNSNFYGPSATFTGYEDFAIERAPGNSQQSQTLGFRGVTWINGKIAKIPEQTLTFQSRNRFYEYRVGPGGEVSPGGGFGLTDGEEEVPVEKVESNEAFTPGGVAIDGVEFGTVASGYALRSGGIVIAVTAQGASASPTNPGAGWLAVAARKSGTGYELFWWHQQTNGYAAWKLDAAGKRTEGRAVPRSEMLAIETLATVDLTWDGFVGTPPATFTSWDVTVGAVDLGAIPAGYALRVGGANGQVVPVTASGGNISDSNPGSGWMAVGARQSGSGYELLWRHAGAGAFAAWTLNGSGAQTGSRGLTLTETQLIESQVNLDLTGDKRIGVPPQSFTSQRTVGGVEFGTIPAGYAVRTGGANGQVIPVTFGGATASATSPGGGWAAVGARQSGSGYEVFWRQAQAGAFALWTLNATGARTGGRGLTVAESQAIESQVAFDITGDGRIGVPPMPFTSQWTVGTVEFGTVAAGYALRVGGSNGKVIPVTVNGANASASNPGSGWVAVAARKSGTVYQLVWKHAVAGAYASWILNAEGARTESRGLTRAQAETIESLVNLDITGDGKVGS